MDLDDLTPVAQDYLKVIWSRTEWGAAPITTGELATRFGTSAANVTETVRRLAGQGLLEYTPYRPVRLTADGTACAVAMVRRHRLLETYLVEALGYAWDEVHDEAERLEHAASPELIDRIDAALGHPASDPHGDPIPSASGRTSLPPGALLLAEVTPPGDLRVVRVSDAEPAVLGSAHDLGLVPGGTVHVEPMPAADPSADGAAGGTAGPAALAVRPRAESDLVPVPAEVAAAVRVIPVGGEARGPSRPDRPAPRD
ncbi:metal-dependent transcriptional regulator [Brachybacterium huguangmaarense]|uniref:Manganese transport regulator n=1 Tax=Brachybacterium huguangmaarense TaxID=1652028 RepID=A0ABY6G360_9MICO|nr:metal-dependent transcriptional regulator [Brachybacterium huguangmaarense]UYG17552.1 metal-dependent transcriptional regulator [Brachybacterium huguangmaarense]